MYDFFRSCKFTEIVGTTRPCLIAFIDRKPHKIDAPACKMLFLLVPVCQLLDIFRPSAIVLSGFLLP
jgi:hypothetical protein